MPFTLPSSAQLAPRSSLCGRQIGRWCWGAGASGRSSSRAATRSTTACDRASASAVSPRRAVWRRVRRGHRVGPLMHQAGRAWRLPAWTMCLRLSLASSAATVSMPTRRCATRALTRSAQSSCATSSNPLPKTNCRRRSSSITRPRACFTSSSRRARAAVRRRSMEAHLSWVAEEVAPAFWLALAAGYRAAQRESRLLRGSLPPESMR
mmetsp:Transcript_8698/g.28677  ORF Transcript_8698/g.28677 Transcript_8698/m.28677 type:complete len:208 (-) Transcript_8698:462-1085(-)